MPARRSPTGCCLLTTVYLLFQQLFPLRVDEAGVGAVGALVGVRAEEVALRLRQVERQVLGAVRVEVAERGREGRDGDAGLRGRGDDPTPVGLRTLNVGVELGVEQQIRQVMAPVVGVLNFAEEARADDAAALPDARRLAEVDVPPPILGAGADEVHALRVRAYLRGVERVAHGLNHPLAVAAELEPLRAADLLARLDALLLA